MESFFGWYFGNFDCWSAVEKCYKISKCSKCELPICFVYWPRPLSPSSPSRLNLPDVDRFYQILPFTISSIKWPVIVSVTHLVFIRSSLNINTTAIEKITNYLIFATSLLSHQLTNFMTDSPVTWKPPSQNHDFGKITKPKSILAT